MFIVLLEHCDIIAKSNFMNVFSFHEGIILKFEILYLKRYTQNVSLYNIY
jgi:hypothetical protein